MFRLAPTRVLADKQAGDPTEYILRGTYRVADEVDGGDGNDFFDGVGDADRFQVKHLFVEYDLDAVFDVIPVDDDAFGFKTQKTHRDGITGEGTIEFEAALAVALAVVSV